MKMPVPIGLAVLDPFTPENLAKVINPPPHSSIRELYLQCFPCAFFPAISVVSSPRSQTHDGAIASIYPEEIRVG